MAQIGFFLRRLHLFAGRKLYLNMLAMIVMSVFEGIGIYLIVPLLGLIGIFSLDLNQIAILAWMTDGLNRLPEGWKLPLILALYAAIVVGQAFLQRSQSIQNVSIHQGFVRSLRTESYRGLLQANWLFFLSKRRSDFIHILTSEIARVSQGIQLTLRLATSFVFMSIQIVFALFVSVELTALVIVSGLALAYVSRKFIRNAKSIGDRTSELSQTYYAGVTEHFNGIKDIKSNRLEQLHYRWFRELCSQMENNLVQFTRLQSTTQFSYRAASVVLIVLFVFTSIKLFRVEPSQLMIIVIIFSRLWPRFTDIQSSAEQIVTNLPAFKNVIGMQRECEESREWQSTASSSRENSLRIEHGMECRHIDFRYDSKQSAYAIHNINLRIPANSMTAIVGKSGAGKSTLIDILIGLIQPERGELLIDGAPLRKDHIAALRGSVSYVSQEPFLFHASIRENLLLVEPDATDEELWEALEITASHEFVSRLPQGLDTVIGDRGARLSGGERQRIVLARAILRKPAILVLDEATSALDNKNEATIQAAIDKLKSRMIIIVVAHRLSTIRNADQVIVLEQGEIIQQGGYTQLSRETKGTFSQLLSYQMESNG